MRNTILLALAAVLLSACGGRDAAPAASTDGADVSTAPAATKVVYVDVRTPAEYAGGHIEGALNIPVEEMEQRWQELDAYRDQQVVLYCRTGRRSGIAMNVLRSKGFTQLENGVNVERMSARGLRVTTGRAP
jgi:rhodanese-related sulfurtransferase